MNRHKFRDSKYSKNAKFISFLEKHDLECKYFYEGEMVCYSANCKRVKVINFIFNSRNINLLGEGSSFYKKYRTLRSEFRKVMGLLNECQFKDICPGFIIIPSKKTFKGNSINKTKETSFGFKVEKVNIESPEWIKNMERKYGIKYILKTKEGYLIGPEEIFFPLVRNLLKKEEIKTYTEIGAGSGELSHYILRKRKDTLLNINEISPHLKGHLKKYFSNFKDRVNYFLKDANKINFPKSNVIFCGIFYGELPELLDKKGKQIINALGNKGLLIIQSAMPENLFSLIILDPRIFPQIKYWPWYKKSYDLNLKFRFVKNIYLRGEILTLASQDKKIIDDTLNNISYKDLDIKNGN